MAFQFTTYDVADLHICGRAFVEHFTTASLTNNPSWSAAVFQWFREAAAPGIRVFPPSAGSKGEFLVDLCHTTYPPDEAGQKPLAWYTRSFDCSCRMKLALESEWGKDNFADHSLSMVLDDACKLAVLRADVKVMVFASHKADDPQRVDTALSRLRSCHCDPDPWLWLDIPNDPLGRVPRVVRFGVIE